MADAIRTSELLVPSDRTALTRQFYNARFQKIGDAINALAAQVADFAETEDTLIETGLERIDETLGPFLTTLSSAAQLGFLVAASSSTVSLTATQAANFVIAAASRDVFTPTPYLLAVDDGDESNWGILSTIQYTKSTGDLSTTCVYAAKTQSSGAWTISCNSAVWPAIQQALVDAVAAKDGAEQALADALEAIGDLELLIEQVQEGPVVSVAGKTGAVTLVEADVGGLVSDLAAKASTTALTSGLAGKQDASAILSSLAALGWQADRVPYSTGPGTFTLATLTSFARTLLDDTTAAAMRATLGLASPTIVTITDGAGQTFDAQSGLTSIARLAATADRTLVAPTNAVDGQKVIIEHTASGGARTLALTTGSAGAFRYGTDITGLSATVSGKIDRIGVIYNAAAQRWDVAAYVKGF